LYHLEQAEASVRGDRRKFAPQIFIEEIGKTGVVSLHQSAAKEKLATLAVGEQVNLRMRGPALIVEDDLGEYLGEVERKYGFRLTELMRGGNTYTAAIASMREDSIRVMIKEVFQHPSQTGRLSF
ncbi:hypothetical protein ACFLVX_05615, partial [Chloroflexota bacterium]